jgi:HEAT repeat protein
MLQTRDFMVELNSPNADVRFAAWRAAGDLPPAFIPEVGKLAGSTNPGLAKAAREALTTLAHAVGKDPKSAKRAAVVKGLLDLTATTWPLALRIHALRLLSGIAGDGEVPAIARLLTAPDMREEAIYCLERIPGDAAVKSIAASYGPAADEFKPRILAALGHRRALEGAAICTEALRSPNKEIATAAVKAAARIGRAPVPQIPEGPERADAVLRFAEAQAKQGNAAEALRLYKSLIEDPAPHVQCAAVIGLSKLRSADAAAAILPKLKSSNTTVRITAQTAWKTMA